MSTAFPEELKGEFEFEGLVSDIIFENDDNGYKVLSVISNMKEITVVGTLPFVFPGERVIFRGKFEIHNSYGLQFTVSSFEKTEPTDPEDIIIFLSSGLIEGIGESTARAIVKRFGDKTFDIIRNDSESLAEVKGITLKKAAKIKESFDLYSSMSETVVFFSRFGIGTALAMRVYKKYGSLSVETVRKNPYIMIDEIPEIGFKTADKIAMGLDIGIASGSRICAGIVYVLESAMNEGHVYLPENILLMRTADILSVPEETVQPCLNGLADTGKIILIADDDRTIVFLKYIYRCEKYAAASLLAYSRKKFNISEERFNDAIERFQSISELTLNSDQLQAVRKSCESGFSIITGGPGTGKTTIIKAIVQVLSLQKKKCVLCAPTGRAAKRMSEACGLEAKTIHRLLEYSGSVSDENGASSERSESLRLSFNRNEENPLDLNVLILDEASMLDIILLYHLLKALPDECQIIFVGDKDQLPSVGPGNVLRDLIKTDAFTVSMLKFIYRQRTDSMIAVNAHEINEGRVPDLSGNCTDFFIMRRNPDMFLSETVSDVVSRRIPERYGVNPFKDIQVITTNRKTRFGVNDLNALLQNSLNPEDSTKAEYRYGDTVFREGDRVMQIKNNYDITWQNNFDIEITGSGIFNGEMGIIDRIDLKKKEMTILFDDDRIAVYDFLMLNQLELCYAITVHKSQGSEFDYCVIVLSNVTPTLRTRNILYTAVTRARKMVVLIGDERIIEQMVSNNSEQERYTFLCRQVLSGGTY